MTYDVAKEKLHHLIEKADHEKVMAVYTLLSGGSDKEEYTYDEETIARLEQISEDAFSGKTKTLTREEFFENLQARRKKNGL